ncbi:Hypothetical predicted protein, partial [Paramuricea clavata]
TLISHECTHIRDRPTLKDAERFRTGSMIHEYKHTFGYKKCKYTFGYLPKSYQKSYQKPYQKPYQKSCTKRDQKCDINTITMTNKTQTNSQTNVNSGQSCLAVNKHVVILADIFYLSGFTRDIHAKQEYKNSNHLKSVSQSALYTDIETNPGPVFIDPGKTICAPYSQ